MEKIYTDYVNRTAITVPSQFIDVRSGKTREVSEEIFEQIEYHAGNETLVHFLLSALAEYLEPLKKMDINEEILLELQEIKKMLQGQRIPVSRLNAPKNKEQSVPADLDLQEVEDILEVFGG